ncbi:MAG: hypothetical protein ACM3ZE_07285 [Myxococcales bacterium]
MRTPAYLFCVVVLAGALLACSKRSSDEKEVAAEASNQPQAGRAPPGVGKVVGSQLDFYAPCNGKNAGDECSLRLGTHDMQNRCVAELDEAGNQRLSCGPRRPPNRSSIRAE